MIKIYNEKYLKILKKLSKLEEKYNIHFKETTSSYILQKSEMYDISWEE